MATFALGLAGLIALVLVHLDLIVFRRMEQKVRALEAKAPAGEESPLAPIPGQLRLVAHLGSAFGFINFPGTLAPVILVALAMQARPVGGDGTSALMAIAIATFSMSASMKAMRLREYLACAHPRYAKLLEYSVFYFVGWTAIILCFLTAARAPQGLVALIVYGYAAITVVIAGLMLRGLKAANAWYGTQASA